MRPHTSLLWCTLFFLFIGCTHRNDIRPQVTLQTQKGAITIELYPDQAPLTVANFLRHVDEGVYAKATFYRTTRLDNDPLISVVQAGLWRPWEAGMIKNYHAPFTSIPHETTQVSKLSHTDGAVSMSRLAPGTANSEFFISVGNNLALDFGGERNSDGQGYAVFGRVVHGMDVVHKVHGSPTQEGEGFTGQILQKPVRISEIYRTK